MPSMDHGSDQCRDYSTGATPLRRRPLLIALAAVLIAAGVLRTLWLTADTPLAASAGIVWHDEGAWVHNARNKALWQQWITDAWNPIFLAPVFTGLEYLAFEIFGVGTWQARTVPVASGLLAVLALGWGTAAMSGARAGIVAAALLATNFFFVMWNRAALMESTMTALIVVSWAAYARAHAGRPMWGLAAGAAAVLAFFTKAAAAFFIAALAIDATLTWLMAVAPARASAWQFAAPSAQARAAARWSLVGLATAALLAAVVFVVPWWSEFRFYNWEMSVTRKPEYTVAAFVDRASWLPVVHHVFTRMWAVLVVAMLGLLVLVDRWRTASPALRLIGLWLLIGLAELVVHDTGNERRYVMLVPALIALAAWLMANASELQQHRASSTASTSRWILAPFVLFGAYIVCGSVVRIADLEAVYAHELAWTVRTAAVLAVMLAAAVLWKWTAISSALQSLPRRTGWVVAFTAGVAAIDLWQYGAWAASRTTFNYRASMEVGRLVPPGTLVHGKLANGLSLENRIKPVFVGREFGNYADRFERTDIRYLLTYVQPRIGYEGPVILDVLDHLPDERIIATFQVQETAGEDVAALIDKFPR